jgi:[protein-PII] uridylyltransferase
MQATQSPYSITKTGATTLLFDPIELENQLQQTASPVSSLKTAVRSIYETQKQQFADGHNITLLINERSHAIDIVLSLAWEFYHLSRYDIDLVAVGGFGRGELHPHSDVDLLLLHDHSLDSDAEFIDNLQAFITLLWDIGLEIGHSVRNIEESITEAKNDITVISNLMESRLIIGPGRLFKQLTQNLDPQHIWPTREFTAAKIEEKNNRYLKFNETAYNLEPNIKEGPGGLRDIQIIGWVAKRHFGVDRLKQLVGHNFLTPDEYKQLKKGQSFLWKIRFALHILCNRHEERLLFDYQRELAEQLGYTDCEGKLAVECFMKEYYQNVMELERLNEMLLQYFQEVIIYRDSDNAPIKINRRFIVFRGFIAAANEDVFKRYPFALLEIFLLLCQNPEIKGVRASTIRLIRAHLYLIDDTFRKDISCRALFMDILRQPYGITHEMRRMNRYGVLAEYLPPFKKIVGQMQHDLYHAYTVDEHTLKVLRNTRRFFVAEHDHEFPLASKIAKHLFKPELLFIASIYHDIAKGRGGKHEEYGAMEVEAFCHLHDINQKDTRLVIWLVKNHLIMSMTGQRKDISDPGVINEFTSVVKSREYLDYLYLLTIADIRATSPKVWNNWKGSLLMELYNRTKHALKQGLDNPLLKEEKIQVCKTEALKQLTTENYSKDHIEQLWNNLPEEYFLKFQLDEIIWQTKAIAQHKQRQDKHNKPLVLIREHQQSSSTEIFIYVPMQDFVFAVVTSVLAKMMLNVTEAKTITSTDGFVYHIYFVLEENGEGVSDPQRFDNIRYSLEQQLSQEEFQFQASNVRLSRSMKQFSLQTHVHFDEDLENNWTIMTITASNRPALLSRIGQALIECNVHMINTKISTFGEKAEDVFNIVDDNYQIITDIKKQQKIRQTIIRLIDETI